MTNRTEQISSSHNEHNLQENTLQSNNTNWNQKNFNWKESKELIQLKVFLAELFQFDNENLDFWIYKVLNQFKPHIENYINKDLVWKIQEEFSKFGEENTKDLKEKLEFKKNEILKTLWSSAFEGEEISSLYKETPLAKEFLELKDKIKWSSIQSWLSEEKIYNEIYTFFKQYYSNGDFVKNKKQNGYYKEKGWDVMFSWATKDQYYIKSWNLLSGYSFYVWKSIENSETGLKEFLWIDWIKKVQFEVVDSEMEKSGEWSKEQTRKFIFGGIKKVPLSVNDSWKEIQMKWKFDETQIWGWIPTVGVTPKEFLELWGIPVWYSSEEIENLKNSFSENEFDEDIGETEYREEKDFYLKDNGETLVLLFEYKSVWEDYKNEKGDKISLTERNVREIGRLFDEREELNGKERLKKWLIEEKARGSSGGELKLGNIESNLEKWESNIGSDFFIHKNLKGFLEEELEYFIKEKLVGSDIILQNNWEFAERYLKKIRILKEISEDIIDFLVIIEDFQKKLWEKKPLVLESNYCITLNYLRNIINNDLIFNEFVFSLLQDELFLEYARKDITRWGVETNDWNRLSVWTIDDIITAIKKGKNFNFPPCYNWLPHQSFFTVDTKFLSKSNKELLLSIIPNINKNLNWLLIKSDNFQWLNLLNTKIDVVYTDPPYNTGNDWFLYKDSYIHSSWNSFIDNRLELIEKKLNKENYLFFHIDENEYINLKNLLSDKFKAEGDFYWKKKGRGLGTSGETKFVTEVEPILVYSKWMNKYNFVEKSEKSWIENVWSWFIRSWSNSERKDRPKLYYPIWINKNNLSLKMTDDNLILNDFFNLNISAEKLIEKYNLLFWDDYTIYLPPKNKFNIDSCYSVWFDKIFIKYCNNGLRAIFKNWKYTIENLVEKDLSKGSIYWSLITTDTIKNSMNSSWSIHISEIFKEKVNLITPKPESIISFLLNPLEKGSVVLDPFCGSWTTLSVSQKKWFKWIWITNNESWIFDEITLPRLKRVIWGENGGISKGIWNWWFFQYIELEQYEDILNNINILKQENLSKDELKYIIKNNLLFSSSPSLSNSKEIFEKPFEQFINIARDWQIIKQKVDLVETFNFLLWIEKENISFEDWWTKINWIKDWKKYLILWFKDGTLNSNKEILENKNISWDTDFIYSNFESILNDYSIKNISIYNEFKTLLF